MSEDLERMIKIATLKDREIEILNIQIILNERITQIHMELEELEL